MKPSEPFTFGYNTNEYVYVTLTEYGKECLAKYHEDRAFLYKQAGVTPDFNQTEFQLWELMDIFGKYIWHGGSPLFENNEIRLQIPDSLKSMAFAHGMFFKYPRNITTIEKDRRFKNDIIADWLNPEKNTYTRLQEAIDYGRKNPI